MKKLIAVNVEIIQLKIAMEDKSGMVPPLRDLEKGDLLETAMLETFNKADLDIATLHTIATRLYLATVLGLSMRCGNGAVLLSYAQMSDHLKIKELLTSGAIDPHQSAKVH